MNPEWDHSDGSKPDLSPEDQIVLDALVEVGFDRSQLENLSPEQKARLDRIDGLTRLLEAYPLGVDTESDRETLVNAALARIDQHDEARTQRMRFGTSTQEQMAAGGSRRIRLPDFVALAAMVLIVASIVLPVFNRMSEQSASVQCQANLAAIGAGFGSFAKDNAGSMPNVMTAGIGGGWDQFSNTENLAPLTDGAYCTQSHFNCPGNCDQGASYSYQMQIPGQPVLLDRGHTSIILADKNPVIEGIRNGSPVSSTQLSANHVGQGYVWTLWSDGTCRQLWNVPIMKHNGRQDNIWLPRGMSTKTLDRGAKSSDDRDVFLAH